MGDFAHTPLYVDLLLWLIYLLLIASIGFVIWSTLRSLRLRKGQSTKSNGIVTRIITGATAAVLVLSLLLTYLLGGTQPLMSNGKPFTDTFWLRTSDMFINTSIILVIIAALAVAFGMSGLSRKLK